ncbi:MAG: cyclic pyranopterin monophosphate synthase MoaC [Chitinivibrionales bacterium]|nr:cyclic pyranopterin monophosphate synthase MoaC [Chitinivibrionales bacterium]
MKLSHVKESGEVTMVDVSHKQMQRRNATATGSIRLHPDTIALLNKKLLKKGDALTCAQLAGIIGAKKTAELIPLCHSLALDNVSLSFEVGDAAVTITANAVCTGRTGVEMEALTAVSIAALTLYDMCKAVDKHMVIGEIKLVEKKKDVAA